MYCSNCGRELASGDKFCPECGTPARAAAAETQVSGKGKEQRRVAYDGSVIKCPQCGEALSALTVICPACGHELRERRTSGAVQSLVDGLAKIDAEQPREGIFGKLASKLVGESASKTDRKVALIRGFVVPNTVEDITEFIFLAAASVDSDTFDGFDNSAGNGKKRNEIAKAWLEKMEQVLKKARMVLRDEEAYHELEEMYRETRKRASRAKLRGAVKYVLLCGWPLIVLLVVLLIAWLTGGFE